MEHPSSSWKCSSATRTNRCVTVSTVRSGFETRKTKTLCTAGKINRLHHKLLLTEVWMSARFSMYVKKVGFSEYGWAIWRSAFWWYRYSLSLWFLCYKTTFCSNTNIFSLLTTSLAQSLQALSDEKVYTIIVKCEHSKNINQRREC